MSKKVTHVTPKASRRGNHFIAPKEFARILIDKARDVGARHGLSQEDSDKVAIVIAAAIGRARFPL